LQNCALTFFGDATDFFTVFRFGFFLGAIHAGGSGYFWSRA
jgi:hypothetical protein